MAVISSAIGFEGYEKRLEISFSGSGVLGLRSLSRSEIEYFLEPAGCAVVASLYGPEIDSYVLSESSLFVFHRKIVIKTCGTTRLLSSIPVILRLAAGISLTVAAVRYSRGTFLSPDDQPPQHRSFAAEVAVLNSFFFGLGPRAYILGREWHVYSAGREMTGLALAGVEVCMTGLGREKAAVFYKNKSLNGKEMTRLSLVGDVLPGHDAAMCEHAFEPCGYSMNGFEGAAYSTVHVTPEEGFSYASYEAGGISTAEIDGVIAKAVACFAPTRFSVVAVVGHGILADGADVAGYACEGVTRQDLPGGGCVAYRTYRAEPKGRRKRSLGLGDFVMARSCL